MNDYQLVDKLEDADVVLFTGGEDVTPDLYGCKKHPRTYNNIHRDEYEKSIFEKIRPDQFVLGICRGSQLLCVLNGGILVQDCDNHAMWGTHEITDGNDVYEITSTHHQMQFPYYLDKKDYDLLFWANGRCTKYEGDNIDPNLIIENGEAEIVLYHKEGKPRCLAVQGHPEMMQKSPVAEMINNLINENICYYEKENK